MLSSAVRTAVSSISRKASGVSSIPARAFSGKALCEGYGVDPIFVENPKEGPVSTPEPQVTTLDNGVRVVSLDTGAPTATVGVFVNAGSRHETAENAGSSYLLQHMFFRDTSNRTHMSLVGEVEALGGNVSAAATREASVLWADCNRAAIPEFMDIIGDTVSNTSIIAQDFPKYYMGGITEQLEQLSADPRHTVNEVVHSEAYSQRTLGRDLFVDEVHLNQLTPEAVAGFIDSRFTARNIIVSGVNADHAELTNLAQQAFGHLNKTGGEPTEKAVYLGGESRITAAAPETNVALVFEGAALSDEDVYTSIVASTLLGGGESFSSGGPGKGMYSRLYLDVLNKQHWVNSISSYQAVYSDAGVFGIRGSSHAQDAGSLTGVLLDQLHGLTGSITDEELNRAKNVLSSAVYMNGEQRMNTFEDLGNQLLHDKKITPVGETVSKIQAVTAADINAFAKKVLTTNPTLVSHGDVSQVPRVSAIRDALSA